MLYTVNCYFVKKRVFIIGLLTLLSFPLIAASNSEFQVGTGLMAFDYKEYGDGDKIYDQDESDDNIFLDGESGLIPGLILKYQTTNNRSYVQWVGKLYYNQIDYDGQTQSGIPIKTKSDALIIDTHVKLGVKFLPSYGREQKVYTGLGYRYWYRNIQPTTINSPGSTNHGAAVAGLLEEYYWWYGLIGYEIGFDVSQNVKMGFDFRLTKMYSAKMDVDYFGFQSYENLSVNLGNRKGARFAIPIKIKGSTRSYQITPYYEMIDIGVSSYAPIVISGVKQNFGAVEPRSKTRNIGIEFTWQW